ncbi:MAG: Rrf2 family transcriptional regulator [Alicyclobacillaceae bacterium]|uniref:RrF2 family transcriptional regulator n=1 Tax=Alicyclobacillus sp. SP_1 TaxID=2942475 RepID=UPI002157BAF1|nr:Rrf2 family transcriptional regulator [Alicyclobacillus sp. SP_1]MCY0887535.1 Rrf2 family transcriptional regulator [Alicyclobacillaceae bacterium]MCY0895104.1 Rrf2 family transcriptional regulator [Alicyclobacillaceae bacterium]
MKVSKRTEYGLRAMVALALHQGSAPVPLSLIAEEEGIPEQFLDQIVAQLRRADFVQSVRGASGGYLLSRPATEISIGSLVRVLEGSLSPMACVSEEGIDLSDSCDLFSGCHTRGVWVRVMEAVISALDSLTLADVLEQPAASWVAAESTTRESEYERGAPA